MDIDDLSAMLAVVLAVSLATERLVTIVKAALPRLAVEQRNQAGEVDLAVDRTRRLTVQAVAFAGAWITSAFMAGEGVLSWGAFGELVRAGTVAMPAPVLALLASGGSAFWTQVLQYTGAVKDIAATRKASESLAFRAQAESMGVTPVDSGRAARGAGVGDRRSRLRMQLDARVPERLDTPVEAGR
jgi:hypothetical protein